MNRLILHNRQCSVDGCKSPLKCKGYCEKHYSRWWYSGNPLTKRELFRANHPPKNGIALINLGHGIVAIVDDKWVGHIDKWNWSLAGKYAARTEIKNGKRKFIPLHNEIMSNDGSFMVDHRNLNKLDNRESNLRRCTISQNNCNKPAHRDSVSRYKGVSWNNVSKKWQVHIGFNKRHYHLGLYDDEEDAAISYNIAAQIFHGEFAWLNPV